ncbi:MAG: hypothetical protein A2X52_01320 [Candidatus Rokubacteria bacterium GWC2_70_16]|nr:MAG: hypothetical protein A2X52_01320 [Candidatus Rokubacteria bacterium GWC2_70_16]OGL16257.1 MAG: hypothetical protein A3K12_05165 [Candidatus Rokubacteria bacterium RIFCSPLOWO2_12_FULL_71_19]
MKRMMALLVSIAFSLTVGGLAAAQPKPATETGKAAAPGQEVKKEQMEKKADKKAEKKAEKKETKADCLKAAKDDAAKADCEKKFAAKKAEKKEAKADKKAEKTEAKADKKAEKK